MPADLFRLDGCAALVTGASAGLGAAMAVALAEAGADVAAHGNTRSTAGTCARIEATGRKAAALTGDLADRSVAGRPVDDTVRALGRHDGAAQRSGAQPADSRADPGRPVGPARRRRGSRGISRIARLAVCSWPRAGRRRRLAGAVTTMALQIPGKDARQWDLVALGEVM